MSYGSSTLHTTNGGKKLMTFRTLETYLYQKDNKYYIIRKIKNKTINIGFQNETEARQALNKIKDSNWNEDTILDIQIQQHQKNPRKQRKDSKQQDRHIMENKKGYYILKQMGGIRYIVGYYDTKKEARIARDKYEKDWEQIKQDAINHTPLNNVKKPLTKTPPKAKKPTTIKDTILLPDEIMQRYKKNAKHYGMNVQDYVRLMVEIGEQQFQRINFIPEWGK